MRSALWGRHAFASPLKPPVSTFERLDGAVKAQPKAIMLRMGGLIVAMTGIVLAPARGKCLFNRIVTGML